MATTETQAAGGATWWWLSFATDDGFLGVAIVGPAAHILDAIRIAHALDCNPGGGVKGFQFPPGKIDKVPESYRDRLLTREECARVDALMSADLAEVQS